MNASPTTEKEFDPRSRATLRVVQTHSDRPTAEIPSPLSWKQRGFEAVKRFIDVLVSLFLIALLSPLYALAALAVRMTSPGPILFCQQRLTRGGRTFDMYKFRTMVQNAERGKGAMWAQKNDPRITPVGKFMRKTRIDELPQLFNVLIGDMSLIGPRPERPEMVEELEEKMPTFRRRMDVKGGLTGLAQISSGYAANTSSYRKKLALDLLYIEKRSLKLDLAIAVKTVKVVVTGKGAR